MTILLVLWNSALVQTEHMRMTCWWIVLSLLLQPQALNGDISYQYNYDPDVGLQIIKSFGLVIVFGTQKKL